MTESMLMATLKSIYRLTLIFGAAGAIAFAVTSGWGAGSGFALGALCSFGNLWLFDFLSRSIAPGDASRKPWQAGVYIIRYILLLGIGYAIVKTLGVSPFAFVLGLLASAAATLTSIILELIGNFVGARTRTE